jgi:hypothetical protein
VEAQGREVHEQNAQLFSQRLAVQQRLWVAEKFADEPAIWFPHALDFRGRVYPIAATGLHPQPTTRQGAPRVRPRAAPREVRRLLAGGPHRQPVRGRQGLLRRARQVDLRPRRAAHRQRAQPARRGTLLDHRGQPVDGPRRGLRLRRLPPARRTYVSTCPSPSTEQLRTPALFCSPAGPHGRRSGQPGSVRPPPTSTPRSPQRAQARVDATGSSCGSLARRQG